jgi:hypothetical protein
MSKPLIRADQLNASVSGTSSFNILEPADDDLIRVGYISTDRGYIKGIGRCEANEIAKKDPGIRFIVQTRDFVKYININQVNELTIDDVAPQEECSGIQLDTDCGPPKVVLSGGGGVGARATPIVGNDGKILSVVVTDGGFGYKYPPKVKVLDKCGIGAGVVAQAFTGTISETTIVYDRESDFEEYEICDPGEDLNSPVFDVSGKEVNKFDAKSYFSKDKDPYRDIILDYQRKLRENERKPFWSSRMNPPLRVIGDGKEDRTKYDVVHFAWGGEQVTVPSSNPKNFEDVQFKIFTSGGHNRGMAFRFASEDGSHKFTIKADDFKENREIVITKGIKRNTKYFVTSTGRYKGAGVEQGLASKLGKKPKEIKTNGPNKEATGDTIFCDFAKSANDNDDLQVKCTQGTFTASNRDKIRGHDTYQLVYFLGNDKDFKPEMQKNVIHDSFMNRYAISPVPPSNVPGSDFAGIQYTFEWEESFPYDGEYKFNAMADNISQVYIDNELVLETKRFKGGPDKFKMFVREGIHKIRVDLFNVPQEREITITEAVETQAASNEVAVIYKGMSKGAGLKTKSNVEVLIDDDAERSFDENASFRILSSTNNARFSPDGKKIIYDGSGSITIRYKYDDNPRTSGLAVTDIEVGDTIWKREFDRRWDASGKSRFQRSQFEFDPNYDPDNPPSYAKKYKEKGRVTKTVNVKGIDAPPPTSGDIQKVTVFDTLSSINKADRKLFRISPEAGKDAAFVNRFGVLPFDITAPESLSDDYAGTHTIRWYDLDFPVDGNYNIEVAVDDNVNLRFVNKNGEETSIEKRGFTAAVEDGGRAIGKSTDAKFFRAGKYTLIAELFQRSGKRLAKGNPMVLAVKIATSFIERTEIVKQSWNENPMGAALTIDAPPVPNLEIPPPKAEGRCPNNPFWTTRFPAKDYWYPVVVPKRWGKFMNRHAISPLPPLASKSTDGGGVVYSTSWDIDVPYRGFFGLRSTVDNGGRILIDGVEVARGGLDFRPNDGITGFRNEPGIKKIFIEEGKHEITVELLNEDTEGRQKFKQKVFSTADWAVPQTVSEGESEHEIIYIGLHPKNKKLNVSEDRKTIRLRDGDGNDTNSRLEILSGDVTFSADGKKLIGKGAVKIRLSWKDDPGNAGLAVRQVRIIGGPGPDNVRLLGSNRNFSKKSGQDTDTFTLTSKPIVTGEAALTGGTARQGVTYEGPALASYASGELGAFLTPAFTSDEQYLAEFQGTTWNMKWTGVNFPQDGTYTVRIQADDIARLRIDGQEVASDQLQLNRGVSTYNINQTAGKKTVEIELFNQGESVGTFTNRNPTVVGAIIDYNGTRGTGKSKSWDDNPIGISAELIPPPCPRNIDGKGVVDNITVIDPGNGFTPPPPGPPDPDSGSFPVSLELDSVTLTGNPINYNCGVDQIVIEPANGAVLSYECDTFGRITQVNVENPGRGFQTLPNIRMITDTGAGFSAVPNFKVVVDPLDEVGLLQVTDLPGIKRTGFVNGRSYYGAVYIEGGLKFAGFFATVGTPVQVYDTLQESIDAEVTTPPSAIQRQGTDIRANDPRLDIPDTPDQLI